MPPPSLVEASGKGPGAQESIRSLTHRARRVCALQHSPSHHSVIGSFERTTVWIIHAAGIAVAVLVAVARLRFANESELGSVTETWLAEYRADQAADSK